VFCFGYRQEEHLSDSVRLRLTHLSSDSSPCTAPLRSSPACSIADCTLTSRDVAVLRPARDYLTQLACYAVLMCTSVDRQLTPFQQATI
jgi:hypothetical protein